VPKDKDFNQLHLRFECDVHHDKKNLLGEYEYIVFVDDYEAYRFGSENKPDEQPNPNVDIPIRDAVLESHSFDIKVIVHYQVDFSRRNTEKEYQDLLKKTGISLKDIRIDNDIVETKRQLTFSDYVNEVGISKDEHDERYAQFWQVSQYKKHNISIDCGNFIEEHVFCGDFISKQLFNGRHLWRRICHEIGT
jgi:hypothetical protein